MSLRRLPFVWTLAGTVAASSDAAEKHPLLLGISSYDYPRVQGGVIPLKCAGADATALENLLSAAGYKVKDRIDREARRQTCSTKLKVR